MRTIDMIATGKNIENRCAQAGYDAKSLSILLNVTLASPYYWFSGHSLPRLDTLVSLCGVLECKLDDLIISQEDSDNESDAEQLDEQPGTTPDTL